MSSSSAKDALLKARAARGDGRTGDLLSWTPPQPRAYRRSGDLYQATEQWVAENPKAYALFTRFALEMAAHRDHFGMRVIAERVRWEAHITWKDEFKINDHYTAYLARRLVREHPELEGKLEFRRVKYGPTTEPDTDAADE